ncbi:hypothetical protein AGMMS49965_09020 [Bacteroidia bacterium]|nr:hypothetical protein AGMMS49965_09020 [Bacteroidia bacterium]
MSKITKSQQEKFVKELSRAQKESDVRIAYRNLFKTFYGDEVKIITEYHNTDILVESVDRLFYNLKLLAEIKYEEQFTEQKQARAMVAVQIIYYLHRFREAGESLPNILVAADKNEIFVLYGPKLYSYLDENFDWTISPSEAYQHNSELFNILIEDPNLDVFVHNLQSTNFDLNYIFTLIDELLNLDGAFNKIEISKQSLLKIFEDFNKNVFGGMAVDSKIKMQILFNKFLNNGKVYLHPEKKNTVCVITTGRKFTEYRVNASQFEAFFSQFDIQSNLWIYKELTEIADTLIEEVGRRFTGDFWTPKLWTDRAHELISEQLGNDWKEKYVVWDAASGTKNLTRDYKFNALFCSTLHEEEIAISDMYNPEATTFQYDFLNDDIWVHTGQRGFYDNLKMPAELIKALQANQPIVFFMNPPFGSNGDNANKSGKRDKEGIAKTKINDLMVAENIGSSAAQELYCQFIYRVQLWAKTFNYTKDLHFFFFNKGFLTSPSFGNFTEKLCRQFTFEAGFLFNAGEFHGTSSAWGIIFSHWKLNPNNNPQTEFQFDVLKNEENEIIEKCRWVAKKIDKKFTISSWINEIKVKGEKITDFPTTSDGIKNSIAKTRVKYTTKHSLGNLFNHNNNVQCSDKYLQLLSMPYKSGECPIIDESNFEKICVTFAVRKSAVEVFREQNLLWVRDKDVFRRPSETLQKSKNWDKFVADCVVYSLFASGSNQTSLRNYEYNGKNYRVNNEFFWLSKAQINALGIEHNNMEVQIDLQNDEERFVYKKITNYELKITSEAKALLDFATELLSKSFSLRQTYNNIQPKYNLNAWDAGWLQIHKMLFSNDRLNDSFKPLQAEFKQQLKALGDKICKVAEADGMI